MENDLGELHAEGPLNKCANAVSVVDKAEIEKVYNTNRKKLKMPCNIHNAELRGLHNAYVRKEYIYRLNKTNFTNLKF